MERGATSSLEPQDRAVVIGYGPTGRTVRVPLTFLGKGNRRAMIVNDHVTDPAAVQVERDAPAKASDTLTLKLRPGGGFIARFDAGAK